MSIAFMQGLREAPSHHVFSVQGKTFQLAPCPGFATASMHSSSCDRHSFQTLSISIKVSRPVRPSMPRWIPQVCAQRDHFAHAGLVVKQAGDDARTVLYAYQNPIVLSLVLLEARSPTPIDTSGSMLQTAMDRWQLEFSLSGGFLFSSAETMCAWSEEMVSVLLGLVHVGGHRVACDGHQISLSDFLADLPETLKSGRKHSHCWAAGTSAQLLAQHRLGRRSIWRSVGQCSRSNEKTTIDWTSQN